MIYTSVEYIFPVLSLSCVAVSISELVNRNSRKRDPNSIYYICFIDRLGQFGSMWANGIGSGYRYCCVCICSFSVRYIVSLC